MQFDRLSLWAGLTGALLVAGCVVKQAPPPAHPRGAEPAPVYQEPEPVAERTTEPLREPEPAPQPQPTAAARPDYARWAEEDKALPNPPGASKAAISVAAFTFHRNVRAQPGAELETAALTKKFITELGQVRKFDIVERDQLDTLLAEMELSEAGLTDPKRAVTAGKMFGVDYFLLGEISVFTVTTRVQPIPRTTRFNKEFEVRLIADMRIVNARTSAMLATEKGDVSKVWRTMYRTRPSNDGKVAPAELDGIQRELCQQLVHKVVNAIFPVRVLRLNASGTVFLNRGEGAGLTEGEALDVFRPGEELVDPDTGEVLGSEETKVARITVGQILAKFSKASIVGGRPRKGYICRPARGEAHFSVEAPAPPRPQPDRSAPLLEVLEPANGATLDSKPIDIAVRVTDDRQVARVSINDAQVNGSQDVYRARMSRPREGENRVRIDAWDAAGNKSSEELVFTFSPAPPPDTSAPVVKFLAPREGQRINASPVNVVVEVRDDRGVSRVQINGIDAERDSGGRYRVQLQPQGGRNAVRVLAQDAAGNRGSAELTFTFDSTPPEVRAEATILVEGKVDDLSATLTINGVPVNFDKTSGRYAVRVPPHPDHPDKVVVVATDEFGNQSREVRKIR